MKQRKLLSCSAAGFTRVPPFDRNGDRRARGTLALELLQRDSHADRVFGSGWRRRLAAGVAVRSGNGDAANQSDCRRRFRLPESGVGSRSSVDLPRVGLFAEGVAVKRIGDEQLTCAGISRRHYYSRWRRYLRGDERSV